MYLISDSDLQIILEIFKANVLNQFLVQNDL